MCTLHRPEVLGRINLNRGVWPDAILIIPWVEEAWERLTILDIDTHTACAAVMTIKIHFEKLAFQPYSLQ
jgi:hypothetical protein